MQVLVHLRLGSVVIQVLYSRIRVQGDPAQPCTDAAHIGVHRELLFDGGAIMEE